MLPNVVATHDIPVFSNATIAGQQSVNQRVDTAIKAGLVLKEWLPKLVQMTIGRDAV